MEVKNKKESNKMDYDKEIKKYEEQAEKMKGAYLQCLGVIQYLKNQKKEGKKEDK